MLSYSNFGTSNEPNVHKVREAVEQLHKKFPGLIVDGEIQANMAFDTQLLKDNYPFTELVNGVNTLIFPNLEAGNIAYKLMAQLGGFEAIGPILLGMNKPVNVLQLGSSIREIVNMVSIAVVQAQGNERRS